MTQSFSHAIVRRPGESFHRGLTTSDLGSPDHARMLAQHQAYVTTLERLGLQVQVLDPLPSFPDSYFVEDVAVVTPRVAIITRPGAVERRGEEDAIVDVLAPHRPLARIRAPGTLEGGDVLITSHDVFIGVSGRTNPEGARQLAAILEGHSYRCVEVPVGAGLHLKSSVSWVGGETVLITRGFAQRPEFSRYRKITLHPDDEYAGNSLRINDFVLIPAGLPRVKQALASSGSNVIELDLSEARKMDGGLSCMSLRL